MPTPGLSRELAQQAMDLAAHHGSKSAAARAIGMPVPTFSCRYDVAVRMGLKPQVQMQAGWQTSNPTLASMPPSNAPAEGYKLKGTSTLVNGAGETVMQWIKTDRELEQLYEMQKKVLEQLQAELKPLPAILGPQNLPEDLLNLYTLTDCHVGMLAWDKETGADWDLGIAERVLVGTFLQMIDSAPVAKVGVVNQLGDFLHFDSLTPMTPTNHHVLDADSRFQKMVEVAVRILRRVIEHALTKHEVVQVYMHEGNHDPAASVWLRVLFAQLYADNPRVKIEMSPNPYVAYLHGQTLLGFHHGHMTKQSNLPQIFAQKFRKEWGQSTHTYVHSGHKHHVDEKEYPGLNWIQHPTLAAPDAYAARGGWLSKRQATSMTYHKTRGEVARGTFIPE